jgi:very-short-patch-repair endonuclease
MRCEVFTNLTADDIDLERSQARGVRALKAFLSYAQKGILDVPSTTDRDFDSPFEEAVFDRLAAAGYQVRSQIGSGGFFIDLAIIDPDRPGRYLLGIECDGATYHSSRSARDRDRLRQDVLEGLGWRIHRIWSTDWFRNPEREWTRLTAAIEAATNARPVGQRDHGAQMHQGVPVERESTAEPTSRAERIEPYKVATVVVNSGGQELHNVATQRLAAWVVDVVKVESPVHVSEVARRITDAAGFKRVGSRIQAAIDAAAMYAVRSGTIRRQGEFLWLSQMQVPPVRDRTHLASSVRRLDLIAPEEIASAARKVVADA